ncbi:hypothetical protein [Ensifer aridi]|uniref:hypothetical protein n=1 Tax=Ensifer aridi TaxID=1708715 RepID=UPI00111BDA22|nr:hypothetical protein [Ensifer aridi]
MIKAIQQALKKLPELLAKMAKSRVGRAVGKGKAWVGRRIAGANALGHNLWAGLFGGPGGREVYVPQPEPAPEFEPEEVLEMAEPEAETVPSSEAPEAEKQNDFDTEPSFNLDDAHLIQSFAKSPTWKAAGVHYEKMGESLRTWAAGLNRSERMILAKEDPELIVAHMNEAMKIEGLSNVKTPHLKDRITPIQSNSYAGQGVTYEVPHAGMKRNPVSHVEGNVVQASFGKRDQRVQVSGMSLKEKSAFIERQARREESLNIQAGAEIAHQLGRGAKEYENVLRFPKPQINRTPAFGQGLH